MKYTYVIAAIFLVLLCILFITWNRDFDYDEMETLSAAGFIFDGKVPYRDFWQMHTPFSYYFFAPVFFFFTTMKIFYAARLIIYLLLVLNGYLLFTIAKRLFSRGVAVFSLLSYLVCLPVLYKMVEIRPDILVVIFSNLSLIFLLWGKLPAAKSFFLAGIFGALAFLSKQSGIIFVFGVTLFFIIRASIRNDRFWDDGIFPKERFNFKTYSFFLAGFFLPCVIFTLLLLSQGALKPFLQYAVNNDFLRAALLLKTESGGLPPNEFMIEMFSVNFMLSFSLISLFFYLIYKKRHTAKVASAYLFIFTFFVISFLSLFLTLHAWRQDFLLLSQYFALLAGPMLSFFYEGIHGLFREKYKKLFGIILSIFMLLFICPPPLFNMYRHNVFGLRSRFLVFDSIISLTNKGDKCLSIEAPCPFRPCVYFYRQAIPSLESLSVTRYREGSTINEILYQNVVSIVPLGYYYGKALPDLARAIDSNYLMYKNSFYIPGKILKASDGKTVALNVIVDGYYRIEGGREGVRIDDKPFLSDTVYLKKGGHVVYLPDVQKTRRLIYDLYANKNKS